MTCPMLRPPHGGPAAGDGYSTMTQFWLEAFQWHSVQRGEASAFYAGDISVGGPRPFNSSGGNLGNRRIRTA